MPYRCVHCSMIYEDGSQEILAGCNNCHGKFFFYIRKEQLEKIKILKEEEPSLSVSEKNEIEKEVREIVGLEDEEVPVFLDFESVKVIKPGKYLLDLTKLFSMDKPKIYKLEDGKYIVDFSNLKT